MIMVLPRKGKGLHLCPAPDNLRPSDALDRRCPGVGLINHTITVGVQGLASDLIMSYGSVIKVLMI